MTHNAIRILLVLILTTGLSACGGNQVQRAGVETMTQWERLVRWSQFDALVDFIHPDYLSANPIMQLDVDRLHQFRVSEYRVRQILSAPDGLEVERVVRLRLIHLHTTQERVVDHREIWRYDPERRAWLLHSGLPDPRRT
ncbi:MAG: hypothetical protein ACXIUM_06170 [Wenzhouxiangella sp.]